MLAEERMDKGWSMGELNFTTSLQSMVTRENDNILHIRINYNKRM